MEQHGMMKSVCGQGTLLHGGRGRLTSGAVRISGQPPSSPSCAPLAATAGGSHCLRHTREDPRAPGTG